jgi:hypothetical protein
VSCTFESRKIIWAGHVARTEERRGAYRVLVGKPEGKRELERWEDNIKMYHQEIDWIDLAQDSDKWLGRVNMKINPLVP